MLRWLRALIGAWREQQEAGWKDALLDTEAEKQVEGIRSRLTDIKVGVILKEAEMQVTKAKYLLAKTGGDNDNSRIST